MFSRLHYIRNISLSAISLYTAITSSTMAMQLTENVDIAIIGGGMAGLTAAYNLNKAGLSCNLFEAKAEVGGRTKTHYFNENQYYELGGTQIDSDHDSVVALAENLGVKLNIVSYGEGDFSICSNDGVPLSDDQLLVLLDDSIKVFGDYIEYNQERDLVKNSMTFQSIRIAIDQLSTEEAKRFWETFIKEECSTEPDHQPIVIAGWLHSEASDYRKLLIARSNAVGRLGLNAAAQMKVEGTFTYRVNGGMSNLVNALKDNCNNTTFEYNHVLQSLSKDESGYQLGFGNKTVTAQNIVMAIPFSTLRDVKLEENLGLTPNHINAIHNLDYSTMSKIGLPVTGQFEMLGHYMIEPHQQFHAWPGHNAVTITVGGEAGKHLGENGIEPVQENVARNILPKIYPTIGEFGKSHIINWANDPFAKGSWSTGSREFKYNALPSEQFPQLRIFAEPLHEETFLFAGEHTIYGSGRSHIEGAVQSGELAAKIILDKRNIPHKTGKDNCAIQ